MSRKKTTKILLLGGSGQIGSHFKKTLKNKYQILAPTHKQFDVTNKNKVNNFISKNLPDQIVYSIGYTSIDQATSHVAEALQLNVLGVQNVAKIASLKKIPVHYLSTEVVFDGYKTAKPYNEKDQPNPLSLNAQLKRLGELVTLDNSPKNSVIRLIICYSAFFPKKLDIARMVVKNLSESKPFITTTDQEINPVYVGHLTKAISILIDNQASGIYHVGAKDFTTPYDFCQKIAAKMGLNGRLIKGTTFKKFSATRPEPRPQHEWLDVSKFLKKFGKDSLHTVDNGIEEFISEYKKINNLI